MVIDRINTMKRRKTAEREKEREQRNCCDHCGQNEEYTHIVDKYFNNFEL